MSTMQLEFFDVPSPCIGICQSDDKGYCKGCFRTRDERKDWLTFDNDGKQKVIKRCSQRKKRKDKPIKTQIIEQPLKVIQPSLLDKNTNVLAEPSGEIDFGDFEL